MTTIPDPPAPPDVRYLSAVGIPGNGPPAPPPPPPPVFCVPLCPITEAIVLPGLPVAPAPPP